MSGPARASVLHVVAGVARDAAGRVLIGERPAGKHLAGGWEFPGGKLDPGETRLAALIREFDEELGLAVLAAHPLIRIRHDYPDRRVLLDVWSVTRFRGEASGRDGQALRWCAVEDLPEAGLLAADRPVVTALRLPERLRAIESGVYVLRDAEEETGHAPVRAGEGRLWGLRCASAEMAAVAAARGADFIALSRALPAAALEALCAAVPLPVYARGLPIEQAFECGASGLDETPPRIGQGLTD